MFRLLLVAYVSDGKGGLVPACQARKYVERRCIPREGEQATLAKGVGAHVQKIGYDLVTPSGTFVEKNDPDAIVSFILPSNACLDTLLQDGWLDLTVRDETGEYTDSDSLQYSGSRQQPTGTTDVLDRALEKVGASIL